MSKYTKLLGRYEREKQVRAWLDTLDKKYVGWTVNLFAKGYDMYVWFGKNTGVSSGGQFYKSDAPEYRIPNSLLREEDCLLMNYRFWEFMEGGIFRDYTIDLTSLPLEYRNFDKEGFRDCSINSLEKLGFCRLTKYVPLDNHVSYCYYHDITKHSPQLAYAKVSVVELLGGNYLVALSTVDDWVLTANYDNLEEAITLFNAMELGVTQWFIRAYFD